MKTGLSIWPGLVLLSLLVRPTLAVFAPFIVKIPCPHSAVLYTDCQTLENILQSNRTRTSKYESCLKLSFLLILIKSIINIGLKGAPSNTMHYVGRETYQDVCWDHHSKCPPAGWVLLKNFITGTFYLCCYRCLVFNVTLSTKLEAWELEEPPLTSVPRPWQWNELKYILPARSRQSRPGLARCLKLQWQTLTERVQYHQITTVLITWTWKYKKYLLPDFLYNYIQLFTARY